jgi:hypothetical protein
MVDRPSAGRTGKESHPGAEPARAALVAGDWLNWALIAVGVAILLAWLYLSVAHVADRYRLDHVAGVRIALARYFNDGILYPPLYDGHVYGGTRFMPLPIILHGLVARVTDEPLISGKLLSYAAMAGLVLTTFLILRQLRCPSPIALSLAAVVLTTNTGLSGSMDMRADVLPLLLQVLAVCIVVSSARPSATVASATLAAFALISKLSAIWALLVIAVWLFPRDRRRLAWFLGAFVAVAGGSILFFVAISEGRMLENVFGLSASGITGFRSVILAPYRLAHLLVNDATSAWALIPIVGLAAWVAVRDRRVPIYLMSFLLALVTILVVLTDVGTGWNQLVDLVVLAALAIGEFIGRTQTDEAGTNRVVGNVGPAVRIALLWVTLSGLVVMLVPAVKGTITGELSYRKDPLAGLVTPNTSLLAEDPYIPVSVGQVPVVLDPFMVLRIGQRDPGAVRDLVRRIDSREFDLVVLVVPLQPLDQWWWREEHFGISIVRAIARAYAYSGRMEGYYVYEPRTGSPSG